MLSHNSCCYRCRLHSSHVPIHSLLARFLLPHCDILYCIGCLTSGASCFLATFSPQAQHLKLSFNLYGRAITTYHSRPSPVARCPLPRVSTCASASSHSIARPIFAHTGWHRCVWPPRATSTTTLPVDPEMRIPSSLISGYRNAAGRL